MVMRNCTVIMWDGARPTCFRQHVKLNIDPKDPTKACSRYVQEHGVYGKNGAIIDEESKEGYCTIYWSAYGHHGVRRFAGYF